MVADLQVERYHLSSFVAGARTDGDELALLRLFLGSVRDDDATPNLLTFFNPAHDYAVMKRPDVRSHNLWISFQLVEKLVIE